MVRLPPFISDMVGWAPSPNPNRHVQAENGVFSYPWRFCPGMLKSTAKIHPRGSQVCVRSALLLLPSDAKPRQRHQAETKWGGFAAGARGGRRCIKGHLDNGCIGGMPWKTLGSQWVALLFSHPIWTYLTSAYPMWSYCMSCHFSLVYQCTQQDSLPCAWHWDPETANTILSVKYSIHIPWGYVIGGLGSVAI